MLKYQFPRNSLKVETEEAFALTWVCCKLLRIKFQAQNCQLEKSQVQDCLSLKVAWVHTLSKPPPQFRQSSWNSRFNFEPAVSGELWAYTYQWLSLWVILGLRQQFYLKLLMTTTKQNPPSWVLRAPISYSSPAICQVTKLLLSVCLPISRANEGSVLR